MIKIKNERYPLYYAVDEEGFICWVSWSEFDVDAYCLRRNTNVQI